MNKKFRVLRIIGTIWKILAWIVLIAGILGAIGALLGGILGGLRQFGELGITMGQAGAGLIGGIIGFIGVLIGTILNFLALYAIGDLIYLMLAIEENTRTTSQWIQQQAGPAQPQSYPSQQPPSGRPS